LNALCYSSVLHHLSYIAIALTCTHRSKHTDVHHPRRNIPHPIPLHMPRHLRRRRQARLRIRASDPTLHVLRRRQSRRPRLQSPWLGLYHFRLHHGTRCLFRLGIYPDVQDKRDEEGGLKLLSKTLEDLGKGLRKAEADGQVIGFRNKFASRFGRRNKRGSIPNE